MLPLTVLLALQQQLLPPLPDSSGWGVHVLAVAQAPDSSIWVGTYGQGIFVLRPVRGGVGTWDHIRTSRDTAAHSISFDFVHAFGFGPKNEVWYGTVGNGWGLSTDNGRTWRNWELGQLGPEWQYVAPNGIVTRGDTTYIATADGIKLTFDDGATWHEITDSTQGSRSKSLWGHTVSQYDLLLRVDDRGALWLSHARGLARSTDGGRTWREFGKPPCTAPCVALVRQIVPSPRDAVAVTQNGLVGLGVIHGEWQPVSGLSTRNVASSGAVSLLLANILHKGPRAADIVYDQQLTAELALNDSVVLAGTRTGLSVITDPRFQLPAVRPSVALSARPAELRHTWFARPIALTDQPFIDQTYRYGSTMGGYFQPHQGVEFNNADGTPVHAIGDGVVVWAGPAERGALTVAIKHDRQLTTDSGPRFLFSVYYHNSKLLTEVGKRVKTGDVISLVGNTGRATNDHLHLEVHPVPYDSTRLVVDPEQRYPAYTTNPELWIEPLPGTGVVAGQVWDSKGQPVKQARIYGLVKPEPTETPFSFIETYGDHNRGTPVYHDHFAIGDVPPGVYTLGVQIEGKRVFRRIRVEAGKLTWVEFRPQADAH